MGISRSFVVEAWVGGKYKLVEKDFMHEKGRQHEQGTLHECMIEFDRISFKGDTLRFAGFAGGMCLTKL